jgi:Ca-activated chloride channel family protein
MFKISFLSLLFVSLVSFANQNPKKLNPACSVYGKVQDQKTSELIPFANLILYKNDTAKVSQTNSDINGEYCLKNIADGNYKLMINYVGYQKKVIKNITVTSGKPLKLDIKLTSDQLRLDEVVIVTQDVKTNSTVTRKQYQNMAAKNINSVSGTTAHYKKGKEKANYAYDQDYNTEEYSHIQDNDFKESQKNPLSTFSIDVDKASYSNVRRFINQGSLPPADAVRIEEMINYFTYDYPQPKDNNPFSINTEYTNCPWNSGHQLIHIGLQGKEIKMDKAPTNNLTFLIDVSGSMNSDDKLPLLKSGLRLLIDQMRDEDHISLVVYAGAAGVVLPPTPGSKKEKIIDALDKLSAGGSTAGGEGILLAYKTAKENFLPKGNNRVILATDGDFNVGASSDGELVRIIEKQREDGVFLTVLGFGTGNYKDSKMEQLADKGNGNYAYIDNILEAKKVLVKEMGGTLLTIAKDVKLQIEFNPTRVKAYRLVGYENRLLNNEDFNDDKKDAGELGSGHTVTAIYEIIPAGSSELVSSIDPLKYQQTTPTVVSPNDEIMTIKFRYKEPKESTSKLMTHIVYNKKTDFANASENCKFSCAVAGFGMLLRDSKYKGTSNFKTIIAQAKQAKGKDEDGYRSEFIRLVETSELLLNKNSQLSKKQ